MTSRTRRIALWTGVGLAVASLIAIASRPRPLPVDIAQVVRGPLVVTLDEEGQTRVRDRFLVSAPVAGRVLRIELEPGDPVLAAESVLATFLPAAPVPLDPRRRAEAEAAVEAAEAVVGQAEALHEQAAAELAHARASLTRMERLAADGVVAADRLDDARLALDTRQEALEAAEFAARDARGRLAVARAQLLRFDPRRIAGSGGGPDAIPIHSPVDGVVLRRLRESEAVVPAGEPLIEVGDLRELEIVTDYLSTDAVRMRAGQRALVERWGGEGSLSGRVTRVEPFGFTKISALGVEEQRVNVVMELQDPVEARGLLGDGYRVETRVVIWEAADEVKVPVGALFRRGDGWAVFAVADGIAAERSVEIGERNREEAQVLGGLEPGEEVVVYPGDSVADGVPVAPAASR